MFPWFPSHAPTGNRLLSVISRAAVAPLLSCTPHGFGTVAVPIPISAEHQSLHAPDSHIISTSESWPTAHVSVYVCRKEQTWAIRFHEYHFYVEKAWKKVRPELCRGEALMVRGQYDLEMPADTIAYKYPLPVYVRWHIKKKKITQSWMTPLPS